jgi:hypothetical protein
LLDGEARAKGRDYFNIADVTHSPNHRYFAWAEDEYGSERFHIYIKDLQSEDILPDPAHDAFGPFVFSPDSEFVYWIWRDEFSHPTKVFRRGVHESNDVEIFAPKETDYLMSIGHMRSYSHVMIRRWNAERGRQPNRDQLGFGPKFRTKMLLAKIVLAKLRTTQHNQPEFWIQGGSYRRIGSWLSIESPSLLLTITRYFGVVYVTSSTATMILKSSERLGMENRQSSWLMP